MIKTNNNQSTTNSMHRIPLYRRAWFIVLIVIILIALISGLIIFIFKPSDAPAQGSSESTDPNPQTTSEPEVTLNDGQHMNEDEPYSDPDQITTQYEGENPNRSDELSGNITYTDYNNHTLSIGTMINQYLSSGTCDLTLTGSNGNTYTASSEIFAAASTSACADFNINNITPDSYQIQITLNSDGKQGTITGEIDL